MPSHSTRLAQRIRAPRDLVYRALTDPARIARWRVPDGMDSEVHAFEARVGGTFRISLHYAGADGEGKTSARTDTYAGRFIDLVPGERVVEVMAFETDDPAMQGEMRATYELRESPDGTDLHALHEGLPPGLSAEDNAAGWRMSLGKLARLVEAEVSGPAADEPGWVADVLDFWFGELAPRDWFAGGPALDARIRERFASLHSRLAAGDVGEIASPREHLAAVIVLDQFSRQLHRDDARAFASDPLARRLADAALHAGFDAAMSVEQRLFLALPFEHSEDAADQARAVALTEALGNAQWTQYARAHQDIIARFGRFPHRNAALGRASTPEELAFLADHGRGF
jgi:uncharacterized protein (DUF924 family)/uncharacterized protein YndB with AHSA1/START domain